MSDVLLMPLIFLNKGIPPHRPPDYCINESVTLAQCLCSMTHTPLLPTASVISYRAHEEATDKNANPSTALGPKIFRRNAFHALIVHASVYNPALGHSSRVIAVRTLYHGSFLAGEINRIYQSTLCEHCPIYNCKLYSWPNKKTHHRRTA